MMRLKSAFAVMTALCLLTPASGASSQERLDMALVLAVDTSQSVDNAEFGLQIQGMADAFRHPAVSHAIQLGAPNGLAVTLLQWSGKTEQVQSIDWTILRNENDSYAFGARIAGVQRAFNRGGTALGQAIAGSLDLLQNAPFRARRLVIDVSGDGANNDGPLPRHVRDMARDSGVQVNAVAILNEEPRLDHYYRSDVIAGSGAFLMTAVDYKDFARAIRMKLAKEIYGTPIARNETDQPGPQPKG